VKPVDVDAVVREWRAARAAATARPAATEIAAPGDAAARAARRSRWWSRRSA
jgi:hypothetical protein